MTQVASRCYWASMSTDVISWCKKCERCSISAPHIRPGMSHLSAERPLEILAMDFTMSVKPLRCSARIKAKFPTQFQQSDVTFADMARAVHELRQRIKKTAGSF